jgi:starch synthase (maltosyl-transferring)
LRTSRPHHIFQQAQPALHYEVTDLKSKRIRVRPGRDLENTAVLRVVIENLQPIVDHGKFPIKRTPEEVVHVTADIFADGHDVIKAVLLHRRQDDKWQETPMKPAENDVFGATFSVQELGHYEYTVEAWIDGFESWRQDIMKKNQAGMDVKSELLEGAVLVREVAKRAIKGDAQWLQKRAADLESGADAISMASSEALREMISRYPDRSRSTRYEKPLPVLVERELARFSAWYELFPRSCTSRPNRHGTFRDCEKRLPYIAKMGFDVLYLPPIHPIGKSFRKGPNNALKAGSEDPGSPWAIGSQEGGHKGIHPQLGTLKDFNHFADSVRKQNMEVALDLAFQCSPDHPYVRENPQWFRHRPDGSIKYAENPPKKYQDIYPLDLECEDWRNLWTELRDVVLFWIQNGVHIFRVDNPHTKAFRFWEWLITKVREKHPDTMFLSEAFTRPKVMRYLAKVGFSQSYTYFTWRNTKPELTQYMTELTRTDVREYLRPNFFANTPDILHEYLQFGGRAAFKIRVVLASTLAASYGIYGPAFELCENRAIPGTEEYLDSEKYQIRLWNLEDARGIQDLVARLNQIRRENIALQFDRNLEFYPVDNEQLLCFTKSTDDLSNVILVVVNLDPHHVQSGWIKLPLKKLKLEASQNFQVHDLLSEARYLWHGETNYVELDPKAIPAHVFRLRRKIKTEHDFDYFL